MVATAGKASVPHANGLLLLCDCGGRNGNRQQRFREDLAVLVYKRRRPIEVAHYQPGCSKFNPIERRMFCRARRALQGGRE
jgi:Rhodopirellula transposase DDE domain